jgi:hypothetical protein
MEEEKSSVPPGPEDAVGTAPVARGAAAPTKPRITRGATFDDGIVPRMTLGGHVLSFRDGEWVLGALLSLLFSLSSV